MAPKLHTTHTSNWKCNSNVLGMKTTKAPRAQCPAPFIINYPKTGLARNIPCVRYRRPLLQFSGGCHRHRNRQIAVWRQLRTASSFISCLGHPLITPKIFFPENNHTCLATCAFRRAIYHYTVAYSKNGKLCLTPVCLELHVK